VYRGIHDFKKGYQPNSNIVKDEKDGLVTDFHSILARWRNHLPQLYDVHGASDVEQTEIHTAEPLMLSLVPQVEMAIDKQKRHKSARTDHIPAEMIKAGSRTIHSEIHKLINSLWKKEELPEESMESITVPFYKDDDKRLS